MHHPYVVIGAGIIGATIARELAYRGFDTLVVEKESSLGMHASGRNSGVIHSGINQHPLSEKAKFCLEGSRLLRAYCAEYSVPMKQCGTLVVARNAAEESRLSLLLQMGTCLGVPDLALLSRKEIALLEPSCTLQVSHALYSPTGAVVDSQHLLESVVEDAQKKGVVFAMGERVLALEDTTVHTTQRSLVYGHLINAGGLEADRLAHLRGIRPDLFIVPFRGAYREIEHLPLQTMIYAPPHPEFPFLGVHLTPTTDGRSLAGPNASLALGREAYTGAPCLRDLYDVIRRKGFWKAIMEKRFLRQAATNARTALFQSAFLHEVSGLTNQQINPRDVHAYRAGIRAQLVDSEGRFVNDLLLIRRPRETHILNAVSPGMTCSLAFAKHVVDTYGS